MSAQRDWVRRTSLRLVADPARVISRLYLPGQELQPSELSRSDAVVDRVLALTEEQTAKALAQTLAAFGERHRDLSGQLMARYSLVAHRLPPGAHPSSAQQQLIGAYFSQEYSVEGAALFNPSIVAHPDQTGVPAGCLRIVMSVRAVGEGHLSSIGFRTGFVTAEGELTLDDPGRATALPEVVASSYSRRAFQQLHADMGGEQSNAGFLLDSLPDPFNRADLEAALARLRRQRLTRAAGARTAERFEWIAASTYSVSFPVLSELHERVLMPHGPAETHGMEDLRLVHHIASDGTVEYRGTYTAFHGDRVAPHLLRTADFRTFQIAPLSGPAAKNKGMAFFPRPIGGVEYALSRWDRESSAVTTSADGTHWTDPVKVHVPALPWEVVQVGNCGSPLETPAGWLVLTHGVGPMRQYAIGALLLDLQDPTQVVGRLAEPLLVPDESEREGYVPNVVYSCGGLIHGDHLLLPYGAADAEIRFALVDLPALLDTLTREMNAT